MIDNGFLSKKRTEVFNSLKENPNNNVIARIKHFAQKVDEGKRFIKDAKEEVEEAYEEYYQQYREAKETLKAAKENLQNDVNNIVKYTAYELDEQKQEVYENHNQTLKEAKEKKKREKARFQKLLAFSEGVALASIDGIAPQYIQAAQEIGNQVMKASSNIIAGHQTQGMEAGSDEQAKLVVKGITKIAKDLIKQKASDDVLSVRKSLAASDTPEVNVNNGNTTNGKVPQPVNAGSN
jgi:Mg2+ and Co2+ transporter CorA